MARRRVGVRDRIAGETAECRQPKQGKELMDTPVEAGYAARWTIRSCREPLLVEATERVAGKELMKP